MEADDEEYKRGENYDYDVEDQGRSLLCIEQIAPLTRGNPSFAVVFLAVKGKDTPDDLRFTLSPDGHMQVDVRRWGFDGEDKGWVTQYDSRDKSATAGLSLGYMGILDKKLTTAGLKP